MNPLLRRVLGVARSAATSALRQRRDRSSAGGRTQRPGRTTRRPLPGPAEPDRASHDQVLTRGAGEYDVARLGLPALVYTPEPDDQPDPGEVVWTWVPFEDDPSQGKDRPVLVVAREGAGLVVLQMTSQDHDRDAADEARWGRHWLDVGTGAWDSRGRPSEVRLDRLLWVDPAAVRREGASLDRERFAEVAEALRRLHA